jgi:pimeloyl-ACP methyl ester carboxylesterase
MPHSSFESPAQSVETTHATVCEGGHETAYRRAGRGEPVVLLAIPGSVAATSLFDALARQHRVYAPLLPERVADGNGEQRGIATRLRGFLDALGVMRTAIVADESAGASAVALAVLEPFRIARLVLVLRGDGGEPVDAVVDALADARVPILTTWSDGRGYDVTVPQIEQFLSHSSDA